MGRCSLARMGPWETLLGWQPGIGCEGALGRVGCVWSPVKDCVPFKPVEPSAQRLL